MKVTIPEITDKELISLLESCAIADVDISYLNEYSKAEKVRILRKTRKSLLDHIHEKQALLDKLDNLIWNIEHGGAT